MRERIAGCLSVCLRAHVCVLIYQSRGSILLALGRKVSLKATWNLRLCFWGSKNILHMVVKSSLLFFSQYWHVQYDTLQGFQEQLNWLWSWHHLWQHDHRAEVPIKKRKNISDCPGQGSLSVAFTNASVLGCCYIVRSQPAASVAVCACAWEKKKKKKDKTNQPPPPACGQKRRGDPDCFRKDFTSSAKGYAAGGSGAPGGSTKALSQDWLCNTDTCSAPRALPPPPSAHRQPPAGEKHSPGSTSTPQVYDPCVWQAQH